MKFRRSKREELQLNLTPLIDIVFLLLIFFMVSTTFTKETHLLVDLPESSGEHADLTKSAIEVLISASGHYSLNGRALINSQFNTLLAAIHKLSGGDTTLPLIITADARTPHEAVVKAMDAAGQLGFAKISITTGQAQVSH